MYVLNYTDSGKITSTNYTDILNNYDNVTPSNYTDYGNKELCNCTDKENNIDMIIPALLLTVQCGLSF